MKYSQFSKADLVRVSQFMHTLHVKELGDELSPAASPQRAYDFLCGALESGQAILLTAHENGIVKGCLVLQFNMLSKRDQMLVGGLWVEPDAPRNTVLQLFDAVIYVARQKRMNTLWLLASPGKNQRRKTYARLGFTDSGLAAGSRKLCCTSLAQAEAGVQKLMKGKQIGINR